MAAYPEYLRDPSWMAEPLRRQALAYTEMRDWWHEYRSDSRQGAGRPRTYQPTTARCFSRRGGDWTSRLISAADELRRRSVGDHVGYVINRNVNFTNVCVKRCGFCAFSRGHRAEQGYFLPTEEILRRVRERGISALPKFASRRDCRRASRIVLHRSLRGHQKEIPEIHVHAFSPEEILYGATFSNRSIEDYLRL